jgi:hypothetical protein
MAKRAAEAGGGLAAAAKAIATQNYAANQAAHRRRVEDSHRAGMNTLGMGPAELSKPEDEQMGDVIVTGDVYGDEAVRMLKDTPTPERPAPDSSVGSFVFGMAVATLIACACLLALEWWQESRAVEPVEQIDTDTDTQYILELVPSGDE